MQWNNDTVLAPMASVDLTYCPADDGRKKESLQILEASTGTQAVPYIPHICMGNWEQEKRTFHAGPWLPSLPSAVITHLTEKRITFSSILWCQKYIKILCSGSSSSWGGWIPLTTPKLHGALSGAVRTPGWSKETSRRSGIIWTEWKRALCVFMEKCVWQIKKKS